MRSTLWQQFNRLFCNFHVGSRHIGYWKECEKNMQLKAVYLGWWGRTNRYLHHCTSNDALKVGVLERNLASFLKNEGKKGTIQTTSLEVDFFELQCVLLYFRCFRIVTKSTRRICHILLFGRHWTAFREIRYHWILWKSVDKLKFGLKSARNVARSTWRP